MAKKLSQEEFEKRIDKIHGNKYDYSNANFINLSTKIEIKCPEGHIFYQTPANHLRGQNCPFCVGGSKVLTTQLYIEQAHKVHGNIYTYEKVEYKNAITKIEIFCIFHGYFFQQARHHLNGHGCKKCGLEIMINSTRFSNADFIQRCQEKFGNKFDYSEMNYLNIDTNIKIKCIEHGYFEQIPYNHLKSETGCPSCSGKAKHTNESFILAAKKVHPNNLDDYSEIEYIGAFNKIKIICKNENHGAYFQQPTSHLSGSRCPKCVSIVSKGEAEWLNYLNIPEEWRQKSIYVGDKLFKCDALDKENKKVYEYNGIYYHGSPEHYNPEDINPTTKTTYGELYQKTLDKEAALKDAGYTVISIWENDWNQILKKQKE